MSSLSVAGKIEHCRVRIFWLDWFRMDRLATAVGANLRPVGQEFGPWRPQNCRTFLYELVEHRLHY